MIYSRTALNILATFSLSIALPISGVAGAPADDAKLPKACQAAVDAGVKLPAGLDTGETCNEFFTAWQNRPTKVPVPTNFCSPLRTR